MRPPRRAHDAPGLFRQLSAVLAFRARQGSVATGAIAAHDFAPGSVLHCAPDWLDPTAVVAIGLPLPGSAVPANLCVVLREGIPATALPRTLKLGGGAELPLHVRRGERAVAQGVPQISRVGPPSLAGTATALVRDRLAPDRNYLLTCGHVVAPDASAKVDDIVQVGWVDGNKTPIEGRLAEWLPALGAGAYRTGIDAALIELRRSDAVRVLCGGEVGAGPRCLDLLAAGIGGRARRDQPVTLRRRSTPLAGSLKLQWSGWVDLPAITPGVAEYFLADAVGYMAAEGTIGGDSGAAVWDADERLMGMHLGALPDFGTGEANAVLAPIAPVLDWFSVQPYLRDDPATMPDGPDTPGRVPPTPQPAGERDPGDGVSIVARTLWGEARGEGVVGMEAVANVIRRRIDLRWHGAVDAAHVCQARRQFSCWNEGDPNLVRMERVMRSPDSAYLDACRIARDMLAGRLADRTDGATHYVAATLRNRPDWLLGLTPCAVIGNHEFYKGIP